MAFVVPMDNKKVECLYVIPIVMCFISQQHRANFVDAVYWTYAYLYRKSE